MTDDHVYLSLAEQHEDDARWAYGTGFEDPLHGVDTALPKGVDAAGLAARCLALGDDALIGAQRLAEWVTRAPELEEELALANIGLDLLGQARLLYARTGQADGSGRDEDAYAYLRGPEEFRNLRMAELPNGDFAFSIVRLLVLSCWRLALFQRLAERETDPVLRAVAAKGVKELAYHREYAATWTLRLGDGTPESHARMLSALDGLAPYVEELFTAEPEVRDQVTQDLRQVLDAAGLPLPSPAPLPGSGRAGEHTPHLAPLLTELQSVARAHPGATW
jgi:ring-1,2-phenylacetyl-CoA epoxidase subunit PaaC